MFFNSDSLILSQFLIICRQGYKCVSNASGDFVLSCPWLASIFRKKIDNLFVWNTKTMILLLKLRVRVIQEPLLSEPNMDLAFCMYDLNPTPEWGSLTKSGKNIVYIVNPEETKGKLARKTRGNLTSCRERKDPRPNPGKFDLGAVTLLCPKMPAALNILVTFFLWVEFFLFLYFSFLFCFVLFSGVGRESWGKRTSCAAGASESPARVRSFLKQLDPIDHVPGFTPISRATIGAFSFSKIWTCVHKIPGWKKNFPKDLPFKLSVVLYCAKSIYGLST